MERLWAPWRMEFILNEKPSCCIFCLGEMQGEESEKERLVLYRDTLSFVMMNRYPYTTGHLLVSPYRHVGSLQDLTAEEMLQLFENVRRACEVTTKALSPQGFNIGINLGKVAGAGVDDHLHIHIVPRWVGDANFMTVVADVRVIPEGLLATYEKFHPFFREVRATAETQRNKGT
ncbi:MAG: HIT domain-containing protein [Deltaproteobacteria bacterium]|nr:HIT domain-containing protein [Deltaproteobacteria bacterium]TLN04256.1 MAG: HIT domain-containing protein [bacterium]